MICTVCNTVVWNVYLYDMSELYNDIFSTVLTKPGDKLSTMLQFDDVKEMWKYFTTTGLPGQGKAGPSPVSTCRFAIHC